MRFINAEIPAYELRGVREFLVSNRVTTIFHSTCLIDTDAGTFGLTVTMISKTPSKDIIRKR